MQAGGGVLGAMSILTLLAFAFPALGAVPDSVRPIAAPADAPAQHAAWAAESGREVAPLVCRVVWPDAARVCFTVVEAGVRRWVTEGDLAKWEVELDALVALIVTRSAAPTSDRPRATAIADMPGTYWVAADGDGWDAALLLAPARIAARVGGGSVLVAVPASGTLLAWRPGDADLDKVMAVGTRRMYEADISPVTPLVHRWDGEAWTAFGEALAVE